MDYPPAPVFYAVSVCKSSIARKRSSVVDSALSRMDVERLPSGKFETNELVLELALIAYNLLRMIGQESLRHKTDQKRRVNAAEYALS